MNYYRKVFDRFVPAQASDYCYELWDRYGFEFKIKKARQTKFGDYRFDRLEKKHVITINNDLNPFAFLITYLHEVAHLITYNEHQGRVNPHGKEWKEHFKRVAQPVLNLEVFPSNVLIALAGYFKNPKASSCSDPVLYNVLREFDEPSGKILLQDVAKGTTFSFQGRKFKKLIKKRTRSICLEISTNRKYLISELAEVISTENE